MITIELTEDLPERVYGRRFAARDDGIARIARNLSPLGFRALDWLAMGGIMTASQLGVATRTLQYWQKQRLVDRVRLPTDAVSMWTQLFVHDLRARPSFWCLGPAGEEIARKRYPFAPLTGYLLYAPARVLHDLILNEAVLRIARAARGEGWRVLWAGTNACEIRDGTEQLIEPDAMLILERGQERKAFAVEYHNEEERRQRAYYKVMRYERVLEMGKWQEAWQLDSFPAILAIFRDRAVGEGYRSAVRQFNARATYYAKILDSIAAGNLREWINVSVGQRESIF
jgi:hypothetical protein